MVSQNAWEKIGRAVGAKTVLVTVRDHARIVAFERFKLAEVFRCIKEDMFAGIASSLYKA